MKNKILSFFMAFAIIATSFAITADRSSAAEVEDNAITPTTTQALITTRTTTVTTTTTTNAYTTTTSWYDETITASDYTTTTNVYDTTTASNATSGKCGDDLFWDFDKITRTLLITGTGEMYEDTYHYYVPWYTFSDIIEQVKISNGVTSVCDYAFYGCDLLTDILIPDSVLSIGVSSFECSGVTSVVIPDSVITIGNSAFRDCYSLEFLQIGNSVAKIDDFTFLQCYSLRNVILGKNVAVIGESAFQACGINVLSVNDSLAMVKDSAFEYCDSLSEIYFSGSKSQWDSIVVSQNNSAFTNAAVYLADEITSVLNDGLNWDFDSSTGTLQITGSGEIAWTGNELAPWNNIRPQILKVVIGDGITSLGNVSFNDFMLLKEVILPESITIIDDWTFDNCSFLSTISLPDTLEAIGEFAFSGCYSLSEITIPASVETIGMYAFSYCYDLTNIILENGILEIGYSAFEGCISLENITIPESVVRIGYDAFNYCTNLKSVVYNAINCTYAGASDEVFSAFWGCNKLTDVTIGEKVESIPACFLNNCRKVKSIVIPDSVKSIGHHAFWWCSSLADITIGNSIEEIGGWAFDYTAYANNKENWDNNILLLDYCLICVGTGDVVIDDSVTVIQDSVFRLSQYFRGGAYITSVVLPSWVTEIDDYMFAECWNLTYIEFPENLKRIGAYAFSGCDSLVFVSLPDSVEEIGEAAFEGCYSLESVQLPENLEKIEQETFRGCESLNSIYIPSSVKSIGGTAFYGCHYINIHCEEDSYASYYAECNRMNMSLFMKEVGGYCIVKNRVLTYFYGEGLDGYDNHVNLVVPSNVSAVGYKAFENQSRVVSVELPFSVTKIYASAFENCTNIERVVIPYTVTSIGADAFKNTNATIVCYNGSYAHKYAKENGIDFELITLNFSVDNLILTSGDNSFLTVQASHAIACGVPNVWESSNNKVVAIDANGNITAVNSGTAEISAVAPNGVVLGKCSVTVLAEDIELNIVKPSTTTINYGDTLVLQLDEIEIPEGYAVAWFVEGAGVSTRVSEDGLECRVTSIADGNAKITAKLVDADENPVTNADGEEIFDEITITSKAGFFQKLISFFKNLFGINRIIY